MRETLKIRHYVVGVIYHAGERSVQIMSSRDLAKYFNIARSTVSIALKELVDQGYLIPVKGKGYFTNPRKIMTPIPGKMPPLILLLHGDGRPESAVAVGRVGTVRIIDDQVHAALHDGFGFEDEDAAVLAGVAGVQRRAGVLEKGFDRRDDADPVAGRPEDRIGVAFLPADLGPGLGRGPADERDHVSVLAAAETMIPLPLLIDNERGGLFIVKRTQSKIVASFFLQMNISSDHIYYVISCTYFLYHFI